MSITLIQNEKQFCFKCEKPFLVKFVNKELNQMFYLCETHYLDFIFDYGFASLIENEEIKKLQYMVKQIGVLREQGVLKGITNQIKENE